MHQDIIKIIDENLNEVAKYEYDAYGNMVNINEVNQNQIAKLNPYRYRSYYYDVETNFYYLNARYYNPEIGRFITAAIGLSTAAYYAIIAVLAVVAVVSAAKVECETHII